MLNNSGARDGVGLALPSDADWLDCRRSVRFLARGVVIFGSSRPWVRQKAGWRRPSGFEQTGAIAIYAYFIPESLWVSFQFAGEVSQWLQRADPGIHSGHNAYNAVRGDATHWWHSP
jgi:hypothetical protein